MPPQNTWKKIVKLGLTAILTLIMGVGVYVGVILVTTSTSNVNTDDIYSMLSQRSTMYDSEGNEIENLYFSEGNRTILEYDEIPEDMVNASFPSKTRSSGNTAASTISDWWAQ